MAYIGVSAVLLVYSSGNNCGNYHFIWHVPDSDLDDALKIIIENIKANPQYFTLE